jgi:hypothetical protein
MKFFQDFGLRKGALLVVTGFVGGISTSLIGVDFVTFSLRGLLFK